MSIDRILVSLGGPLVLLAGVACLAAPAQIAQLAGLSPTAGGLTDVRAVYGGLQIGLGLFLLWCRSDPGRTSAGLVALGLGVGGVGLSRVIGLLVDQAPNAYHLANLGIEAGTTALVLYALARREASPA